jgi:hypothetical protein
VPCKCNIWAFEEVIKRFSTSKYRIFKIEFLDQCFPVQFEPQNKPHVVLNVLVVVFKKEKKR